MLLEFFTENFETLNKHFRILKAQYSGVCYNVRNRNQLIALQEIGKKQQDCVSMCD